jgi:hypothetical protein
MEWETPVDARLDIRPYYDVKMRASACHASQGGGVETAGWIPTALTRRLFGFEAFTRGYPSLEPGPHRVETDLFPG